MVFARLWPDREMADGQLSLGAERLESAAQRPHLARIFQCAVRTGRQPGADVVDENFRAR